MNKEIRKAIEDGKLKYYEIAHEIGVNPSTLSVWLRYELSEDRKKMINSAISNLREGK